MTKIAAADEDGELLVGERPKSIETAIVCP